MRKFRSTAKRRRDVHDEALWSVLCINIIGACSALIRRLFSARAAACGRAARSLRVPSAPERRSCAVHPRAVSAERLVVGRGASARAASGRRLSAERTRIGAATSSEKNFRRRRIPSRREPSLVCAASVPADEKSPSGDPCRAPLVARPGVLVHPPRANPEQALGVHGLHFGGAVTGREHRRQRTRDFSGIFARTTSLSDLGGLTARIPDSGPEHSPCRSLYPLIPASSPSRSNTVQARAGPEVLLPPRRVS